MTQLQIRLVCNSGKHVRVPSETVAGRPYDVYTGVPFRYFGEPVTADIRPFHGIGDGMIPAIVWMEPPHCTCEAFRFAKREPGVLGECKHLRFVLYGQGMS